MTKAATSIMIRSPHYIRRCAVRTRMQGCTGWDACLRQAKIRLTPGGAVFALPREMQIDDPDRPPALQLQEYLPESLKGRRYYEPGQQGREASIKKWLEKRRGKEV